MFRQTTNVQTWRETHGQTEKQTDRQTDRQKKWTPAGLEPAYKAESRGFESCRSPLFLPLSFHHSDDTAMSFSQAGLGLIAPDFTNHFFD